MSVLRFKKNIDVYKFIERILLLGFLSILVIHCSSDDAVLPQTENETFNKLLQEAPSTIIDFDAIPVDTVIVTSDQILGAESSSWFSEPVYLGFPTTSFIKVKNSLYVANRQKIYVMDKEGIWQRSFGREGQGPGEFASSVKIANNSKYIIAFDYWNGRIQVFDHDLNLLFIINKNFHDSLLWKNFALNDSYLYLGLSPHSNDDLVGVYRTDDLENQVETFWPKIIPNGLQPGPYNDILIDINNNDDAAIANQGLPYLFLLGSDREIEHILYFESTVYQQSENPSARPVKVEGNTERDVPGVKSFFKQIQIMDDHSIYFSVWNNLYKIIQDGKKYRLQKAWHFIHKDPLLRENTPKGIDIGGMLIEDGTLYFISLMEGSVFRMPLN